MKVRFKQRKGIIQEDGPVRARYLGGGQFEMAARNRAGFVRNVPMVLVSDVEETYQRLMRFAEDEEIPIKPGMI